MDIFVKKNTSMKTENVNKMELIEDKYFFKDSNGNYILDLSNKDRDNLPLCSLKSDEYLAYNPQKDFFKRYGLDNEILKTSTKECISPDFINYSTLPSQNLQLFESLNAIKDISIPLSRFRLDLKTDELTNSLEKLTKASSLFYENFGTSGIIDKLKSVCLDSNFHITTKEFSKISSPLYEISDNIKALQLSFKNNSFDAFKNISIQSNLKFDTHIFDNITSVHLNPYTYTKRESSDILEFKDENSTLTQVRDFEYKLLKNKLEQYTIEDLIKEINKIARREDVMGSKIKRLILNIKNSLNNLLENFYIKKIEFVYEELCEEELLRLNINYYLSNEVLKVLNPDKYQNYLELLHKGIKAYHQDFGAFVNTETDCSDLINTFFITLLKEIETLLALDSLETQKTNQLLIGSPINIKYPRFIFKNHLAYDFFKDLATYAKNAEQIAFYFRYMSEKESQKLIIAKQEVFRTWFNEKFKGSKIELKNPLKAFDLIKGQDSKLKVYNLVKEKYINDLYIENL